MINFWIALRNPFKCRDFRNVYNIGAPITDNKYWEFQYSRYAFNWLEFKLDLNWRQTNHAGPWLTINVFGHTIDLRIWDRRDWDDSTYTWRKYDPS